MDPLLAELDLLRREIQAEPDAYTAQRLWSIWEWVLTTHLLVGLYSGRYCPD